jgi:hypothetical protein
MSHNFKALRLKFVQKGLCCFDGLLFVSNLQQQSWTGPFCEFTGSAVKQLPQEIYSHLD